MENLKKLVNLSEFKTKEASKINGGGGAYKSYYTGADGKCKYVWRQCYNGECYEIQNGKPVSVDCD